MPMRERVTHCQRLLEDYLTVEAADIDFIRADGSSVDGRRLVRVQRQDAAAVLLIDRPRRELVLVEQFRWPTYEKGPGHLLEIVAGVIEPAETPEGAARREAQEEAGARIDRLTPIATCYPTPGYSTERAFVFAADIDDSDPALKEGGTDLGEITRPKRIGFDEAQDSLVPGRIQDAKTLIALQWFCLRGMRD